MPEIAYRSEGESRGSNSHVPDTHTDPSWWKPESAVDTADDEHQAFADSVGNGSANPSVRHIALEPCSADPDYPLTKTDVDNSIDYYEPIDKPVAPRIKEKHPDGSLFKRLKDEHLEKHRWRTILSGVGIGSLTLFALAAYDNQKSYDLGEAVRNELPSAVQQDGFHANDEYSIVFIERTHEGVVSGSATTFLNIGACSVKGIVALQWNENNISTMNVYDYELPLSPQDSRSASITVQNLSEVQQLSAYQDCFKLKEATN